MKNWKNTLKMALLLGALPLALAACNQESPAVADEAVEGAAVKIKPRSLEERRASALEIYRTEILPELDQSAKKALAKGMDIAGWRYFVKIETSNVPDAGTGATVMFTFRGDAATDHTLGSYHLDTPNHNDFERGKTRLYMQNASGEMWWGKQDIGAIAGITLSHNDGGTKPGWHVGQVIAYKCWWGDGSCYYYDYEINTWIGGGHPLSIAPSGPLTGYASRSVLGLPNL